MSCFDFVLSSIKGSVLIASHRPDTPSVSITLGLVVLCWTCYCACVGCCNEAAGNCATAGDATNIFKACWVAALSLLSHQTASMNSGKPAQSEAHVFLVA